MKIHKKQSQLYQKFFLKISFRMVFIGPQSSYEVNSSKTNFFVFGFRSLQKKFYYANGSWQKIFSLKKIFFYLIKICFYLVKNFCFSIFSKRATRIFFILPILETSDVLFSYSIGILNGHQKFEMFLVLTSVLAVG